MVLNSMSWIERWLAVCFHFASSGKKDTLDFKIYFPQWVFFILIYISNCRTYDVDTMQTVISFSNSKYLLIFWRQKIEFAARQNASYKLKAKKIEFCNKQGLQPIPPRVNLSNWIVDTMSNTKLITTIAETKTITMGETRTPVKFRERT